MHTPFVVPSPVPPSGGWHYAPSTLPTGASTRRARLRRPSPGTGSTLPGDTRRWRRCRSRSIRRPDRDFGTRDLHPERYPGTGRWALCAALVAEISLACQGVRSAKSFKTRLSPQAYTSAVAPLASNVAFSAEPDIVVSNTIGVDSLQHTKRLVNTIVHTTPTHPAIGQSVVNRVTHRIITAVGTSPAEKTIP